MNTEKYAKNSMILDFVSFECSLKVYSVLPRNILRDVEIHAALSAHIISDGCKEAQGKKVSKLLWILGDLL